MSLNTTLQIANTLGQAPLPFEVQVAKEANRLYEHAYGRGTLSRLWAQLTGRSNALLALAQVQSPPSGHYAGIHAVPLQQIRGSEGRSQDFDRTFHPLQKHTRRRWISIASAWYTGQPLPPVVLIQVGDDYYVRDGHHRISVAHALGHQDIDAEVIVWQAASRPATATPARWVQRQQLA